ncbi:MAG: DUF4303 domain-containing protein [Planctomycetales bacterium]|nr:DUF4303 domain-containing protein [Planctomycetales bacterium]
MKLSFCKLREIYRDEARNAFNDMKTRYPEGQIVAFALLTDEDCMSCIPRADTKAKAMRRLKDNPSTGWLGTITNNWSYRWNTAEWSSIYDNKFKCAHPSPVVPKEFMEAMSAFRQKWTDNEFNQKMLRTFVDVLWDLDKEGLFGEGDVRDELTLFVEICDSNLDMFVKLRSASLLNPVRSRRRLIGCIPLPFRIVIHCIAWVRFTIKGPLIALSSPK